MKYQTVVVNTAMYGNALRGGYVSSRHNWKLQLKSSSALVGFVMRRIEYRTDRKKHLRYCTL